MRENAAAAAGTRKLGLTPALTEFLIEARSSTGEMTEGQEDRTGGQNKATAATAATALETEEGTPVQKYNGYNSSRPTNNSGNYGNSGGFNNGISNINSCLSGGIFLHF